MQQFFRNRSGLKLLSIIIIGFIGSQFLISINAQIPGNRVVSQINIQSTSLYYTHTVNSDGMIAQGDSFIILDGSRNILLEGRYSAEISQWLANTAVFEPNPYFSPGEPIPDCPINEIYFGFYDVQEDSLEDFCIPYPPGVTGDFLYTNLVRSPLYPYILLSQDRYLINLQENTVTDLIGTYPGQVSVSDTVNWYGHDNLWWSPSTEQSTAKALSSMLIDNDGNITQQHIQMCTIDETNCNTLVDVSQVLSDPNAVIRDLIVSPDGQNLLWTVAIYPVDAITLSTSRGDLVENILAFETNVLSGQTIQIFSLLDYNVGNANGFTGIWSRDGRVLAVGLGNVPIGDPNDGTLFVSFTTPDYPATFSGTVWEDVNEDGIQNDTGMIQQNRTVNLYDNSGQFLENSTTDANGQYSFVIEAGLVYNIGLDIPANYDYSPQNVGSDDTIDSDIDPTTGLSDNIIVVYNQSDDSWDIGISLSSNNCDSTISASDTASLISAINTGNSAGSPYSICLAENVYTLNAVDNSNFIGANALPVITGDITIIGNGATLERAVSAPDFRFLRVENGATLTLENLTLHNGHTSGTSDAGDGGALYNDGTLSLDSVILTNNTANIEAGAIYNNDAQILTITNSSFTGNRALGDDGGAIDNHGTATISSTTFADNHADSDDGGAIWNDTDAILTISDSIFSLNTAFDEGGIIMNFGTISLTNNIIANNSPVTMVARL